MIVLKIRLFLKIKELLSAITPLKIWLILALPKLISLMSCKAVTLVPSKSTILPFISTCLELKGKTFQKRYS
jgi:hypothetical protein